MKVARLIFPLDTLTEHSVFTRIEVTAKLKGQHEQHRLRLRQQNQGRVEHLVTRIRKRCWVHSMTTC